MAIEQFIEPNFRVLIGYFLLMRLGCWLYFRRSEREPSVVASLDNPFLPKRANRTQQLGVGLVWSLFQVPILLYAILPTAVVKVIGFPDAVRWIIVAFAVVAMLLYLWSKHVDSGFDAPLTYEEQLQARAKVQPFRIVRHPAELSDIFLFITLAAISDRALVAIFAGGAIVVQVLVVVANRDARLGQAMGADFDSYSRTAGRLLPKVPLPKKARYQVPRRFGMGAILALMTGLCLLFGLLNFLDFYEPVPREVYFFVTIQIIGICVAQMVFGSAPRSISAIVGAVLLPAFVCLHLFLSGENLGSDDIAFLFLVGAPFGAVAGYCMGAIAAGFFLVMDWLDNWYSRKSP